MHVWNMSNKKQGLIALDKDKLRRRNGKLDMEKESDHNNKQKKWHCTKKLHGGSRSTLKARKIYTNL